MTKQNINKALNFKAFVSVVAILSFAVGCAKRTNNTNFKQADQKNQYLQAEQKVKAMGCEFSKSVESPSLAETTLNCQDITKLSPSQLDELEKSLDSLTTQAEKTSALSGSTVAFKKEMQIRAKASIKQRLIVTQLKVQKRTETAAPEATIEEELEALKQLSAELKTINCDVKSDCLISSDFLVTYFLSNGSIPANDTKKYEIYVKLFKAINKTVPSISSKQTSAAKKEEYSKLLTEMSADKADVIIMVEEYLTGMFTVNLEKLNQLLTKSEQIDVRKVSVASVAEGDFDVAQEITDRVFQSVVHSDELEGVVKTAKLKKLKSDLSAISKDLDKLLNVAEVFDVEDEDVSNELEAVQKVLTALMKIEKSNIQTLENYKIN